MSLKTSGILHQVCQKARSVKANLLWYELVTSVGKLSQACGVGKIRRFADTKIFHLICFSLFHSHLQYCIIDWGERVKLLSNQCKCYKTEFWNTRLLATEHQVQTIFLKYLKFSKFLLCTNLIWKSLCISIMPISCPLLLITFFKTALHTWSWQKTASFRKFSS